jgi:hypothetical protein
MFSCGSRIRVTSNKRDVHSMHCGFMNYVSRCEGIMESWQTERPGTNRTQQSSGHALLSDRCLQIPVFNAQRQYPDNLRSLLDYLFRLDSAAHLQKGQFQHLTKPNRASITKINCCLVSEFYENPEYSVQENNISRYVYHSTWKGHSVNRFAHSGRSSQQ